MNYTFIILVDSTPEVGFEITSVLAVVGIYVMDVFGNYAV